jgi:hypothetical protein
MNGVTHLSLHSFTTSTGGYVHTLGDMTKDKDWSNIVGLDTVLDIICEKLSYLVQQDVAS